MYFEYEKPSVNNISSIVKPMFFFSEEGGQGIKKYVRSGEGGNSKAYKSVQGEGGAAKMTILERTYFLNGPINKREKVRLDHFKDPKTFMEYLNDMQDGYKNYESYNPGKKRKILIVLDDMIADIINNKKLNPVVTELFIRGRKLNISIVFITQWYFKVPKDVRLNSTHFCIMKIPNKRELQQIALNHSSDIDFNDFLKI